ncbi:DUF1304 domain-containing protein [uncultured Algibacter sp.]|uniref:DUF1304 domain-containing protein n=1 Tax=uncultured Algibacter sp. TaxID=298659 RepID=UPI00261D59F5|nr:DUF1304 domain-containing protein [uncultured Algibacter sp.]
MNTLAICLILFVALLHFYFLVLEMFLWTSPKGIKTFGLKSKQFAEDTKVLAANQGLYNGFLSAGLVFAIMANDIRIAIFFLTCVALAGIYGAYTTKKIKLFYIQSVPALAALVSLLL